MSRSGKILTVITLVFGTLAFGFFCGWLATCGDLTQAAGLDRADGRPKTSLAPEAITSTQSPPFETQTQLSSAAINNAPLPSQFEKAEIEQILSSGRDCTEMAAELVRVFPELSTEAQSEAAQYLSYLLPDADFDALGQYLTNPQTPEPVLEIAMAGLLNRPDKIRLPYLLEVARDERNPKASEAAGLLESILDKNYGKDWDQWAVEVDQWLEASSLEPTSASGP